MSRAGITGMKRAAQDIVAVAETFTDADWQTPSAASGWSVRDVVTHLACLLGDLVAAVNGQTLPEVGIEKLNDIQVAEQPDRTGSETVTFLTDHLTEAIATFEPLQDEPIASTETQMLDLGSYPLHAIADMFTFDMATHLRYDILAPRGPIRRDLPALDEAQLGPAVAWLLGGIPKMQPDLIRAVSAPLALTLTGPAGQEVVISADHGVIAVLPAHERTVDVAATITSTTTDFLAWSTGRLNWRSVVTTGPR
ncbi:MAG: maleylpyruvate isomerase N-terminal domain-containing protein [Mycobacterium sp.]